MSKTQYHLEVVWADGNRAWSTDLRLENREEGQKLIRQWANKRLPSLVVADNYAFQTQSIHSMRLTWWKMPVASGEEWKGENDE